MNRQAFLRRSAGFIAGLYISDALLDRVAPAALSEAPGGLPVGTVQAFSGETLPEGYIWGEGQLLKVKDYPKLYAVIRNDFGPLPNKRVFKAPDFRGRKHLTSGDSIQDDVRTQTVTRYTTFRVMVKAS